MFRLSALFELLKSRAPGLRGWSYLPLRTFSMAICGAHPPSLEAWALFLSLAIEPGRALMLKGTEGSKRGPERGSSPSSQVTSAFGLILRARPAYG